MRRTYLPTFPLETKGGIDHVLFMIINPRDNFTDGAKQNKRDRTRKRISSNLKTTTTKLALHLSVILVSSLAGKSILMF